MGIQMADGKSGGNNGMLYFIVGALVVADDEVEHSVVST